MKRKKKNLERAIEILSKQYEGNHKVIMDIVYAEQQNDNETIVKYLRELSKEVKDLIFKLD